MNGNSRKSWIIRICSKLLRFVKNFMEKIPDFYDFSEEDYFNF